MGSGIRLVLISLFALFICGLIWLTLKAFEKPTPSVGSSSTPNWVHPMSQMSHWELKRPTQCQSEADLLREIETSPEESTKDQIWFIDIQPQREEWVIFCNTLSSAELIQRWQKGVSFGKIRDHLLKTKKKVIFNLHASQRAEAEDFLDAMADFETSNSIGVVSSSRFPVEKIRKERPQWIFGSDRATWTKVLAFSSFRLGGLVSAWADFYIVSEKEQQSSSVRTELLQKLSQQNKILIKETSSDTDQKSVEEFYRGTLPVMTGVAPK